MVVDMVAQSPFLAAPTARRSETFIGAGHCARLARRGAPDAITATVRELAGLIHTLVTRGEEHVEPGIWTIKQRRINRTVTNLGRRAKRLSCQLVMVADDEDAKNSTKSVA